MNSKADVEKFLSNKRIALAGMSRAGNKFSNSAAKELRKKGYQIIPVNPEADEIGGEKCYRRIGDIEMKPEGVLVMTPSSKTREAVQEALDAGITNLWLQQGADTEEAGELARQGGGAVVSGECILMFAEPTPFLHKFHRGIWKLLGKLPE